MFSFRALGDIPTNQYCYTLFLAKSLLTFLPINTRSATSVYAWHNQASKNPDWIMDGVSMLPYVAPGSDPNVRVSIYVCLC